MATHDHRPTALRTCVVPADYLLSIGFKTVRPHPSLPAAAARPAHVLTWREDVEVALERLLGSMHPFPVGAHRQQVPLP